MINEMFDPIVKNGVSAVMTTSLKSSEERRDFLYVFIMVVYAGSFFHAHHNGICKFAREKIVWRM